MFPNMLRDGEIGPFKFGMWVPDTIPKAVGTIKIAMTAT
jgi:hypothetical protein